MLKSGAYYRDTEADLQVRSALVADIDPVFLKAEYLGGLKDARWGRGRDFSETEQGFSIGASDLRSLYEAVLAFNEPLINDPLMRELFDFQRTDRILLDGGPDVLLDGWSLITADILTTSANLYEEDLAALRLGLALSEARERQGLTQHDIGVRAGIPQETLSRIERGRMSSLGTLQKIADALGVQVIVHPGRAVAVEAFSQQRAA